MAHNCRALVIHCMDYRFGKAIKQELEDEKLLGDADIVAMAGAAKNLVDPEMQGFVLKQIEISKNLHDIKEVYLYNHLDCGAYGGRKAFESDEAERLAIVGDMEKASEVIKSHWPDLMVHLRLAHIEESPEGNKIWFEKLS